MLTQCFGVLAACPAPVHPPMKAAAFGPLGGILCGWVCGGWVGSKHTKTSSPVKARSEAGSVPDSAVLVQDRHQNHFKPNNFKSFQPKLMQTGSNHFKQIQTISDQLKPIQTNSKQVKPIQTNSNQCKTNSKPIQTNSNQI